MKCAHCQAALDLRTDRSGFSAYCAHCSLWTLSLGILMRHSDRRLFVDAWEFITSSVQWPTTKPCTRCQRSLVKVPLKISGKEHRLEACRTCHTAVMPSETLSAFFKTRYAKGWIPPEFAVTAVSKDSPKDFRIRNDKIIARVAGVPIRELGSGLLVITIVSSFAASSLLGFWFVGTLILAAIACALAPRLLRKYKRQPVSEVSSLPTESNRSELKSAA